MPYRRSRSRLSLGATDPEMLSDLETGSEVANTSATNVNGSSVPEFVGDGPEAETLQTSSLTPVRENMGFFKSFRSDLPKVVWKVSPKVVLKLRKQWYPLKVTRLTLGMDYDVRQNEWDFKWSWKDRYLGAQLTWSDGCIGVSKRFDLEHRTSFDIKAMVNLQTRRVLFSMNILPFRGIFKREDPKGFAVRQKVPLDKNSSVDVLARVQLPETRFAPASTSPISFGDGDFIVDVHQINFRLLLQ